MKKRRSEARLSWRCGVPRIAVILHTAGPISVGPMPHDLLWPTVAEEGKRSGQAILILIRRLFIHA